MGEGRNFKRKKSHHHHHKTNVNSKYLSLSQRAVPGLHPRSRAASWIGLFHLVFRFSATRTGMGLRTGVCGCPSYLWIHRWACRMCSERPRGF